MENQQAENNGKWFDSPYANPDNTSHIEKIHDELRAVPHDQTKFYGLNLGLFKIGVTNDGAFNAGVNVGIAHAEAKVGLVNGAEAAVNLGPLVGAKGSVYANLDERGVHGHGDAGGHFLNLVGGGGEANVAAGTASGAEFDGNGYVGPFAGRARGGGAVGENGLDGAAGGGAKAGDLAAVHGGGHLNLGENSQVAGAVGLEAGKAGFETGAGVWSDGNRIIRPDVIFTGRNGDDQGAIDFVPPPGSLKQEEQEEIADGPPRPLRSERENIPDLTIVDSSAQEQKQDQNQRQIDAVETPPAENSCPQNCADAPSPQSSEPPTPERMEEVRRAMISRLCDEYTYTVQKGDTYLSIAAKLNPCADDDQRRALAFKLEEMHHDGGFKTLRPGQHIGTEDPYTIDRLADRATAAYFGLEQS